MPGVESKNVDIDLKDPRCIISTSFVAYPNENLISIKIKHSK